MGWTYSRKPSLQGAVGAAWPSVSGKAVGTILTRAGRSFSLRRAGARLAPGAQWPVCDSLARAFGMKMERLSSDAPERQQAPASAALPSWGLRHHSFVRHFNLSFLPARI